MHLVPHFTLVEGQGYAGPHVVRLKLGLPEIRPPDLGAEYVESEIQLDWSLGLNEYRTKGGSAKRVQVVPGPALGQHC